MDIKRNISTIIRNKRKNKGLSQKDFSQKLGISRSYLSEIENGDKDPTLDIIIKLIHEYGTPPDKLFLYPNEASLNSGASLL